MNVGVRAARRWLTSRLADPDANDATLLQAVLGLRCCETLDGTPETYRDCVARIDARGTETPLDADAALALIVGRILEGREPVSNRVAGFVSLVRDALRDVPGDDPALALTRLLAGFDVSSDAMPALPSATDLLFADETVLRRTVVDAAVATRFGTVSLEAPAELVSAILACAVDVLSSNDLELGSGLVRSAGYLGAAASPTYRLALAHLAAQQQGNGSFGAYLEREMPGPSRVAVTVAALWTLAEARGPFVLS